MPRYVVIDGVDAFLSSPLGLARGRSVGTAAYTDSIA